MVGRSETSPFEDEVIERASLEVLSGETSETTEAAIRASTPKRRPPKRVKRHRPPEFEITAILEWAKSHHERTGAWPNKTSGRIAEAPAESWQKINQALRQGLRGLPGGNSLARLLFVQIGADARASLIAYSVESICEWAMAWHERTGAWPARRAVAFPKHRARQWLKVNTALSAGIRGLPGGSTLAKLLAEHLGVENRHAIGPYTGTRILAWVDECHDQHGCWPTARSGEIPDSGGATWMSVQMALVQGRRQLPGGSSLPCLLGQHRGVLYQQDLPPLSMDAILQWAEAHKERTGRWPIRSSGVIPEAPGENWRKVDAALRVGNRGCPGGSSLARFLSEERGVRNRTCLPRLTIDGILEWSNQHRQLTGSLPSHRSGSIPESPGDTWSAVDVALKQGLRGLPGGVTLARLLLRETDNGTKDKT